MTRAAVLWDMDGVLVDSGEAHYEAWRRLAATRGVVLTRDAFLPTFGMANPDAIPVLFGAVPTDEAHRIAADKEDAFRRLSKGRVHAHAGAIELLKALHARGHRQALASSAPRDNIAVILGELGVASIFDAAVSGDDISRGKPDPEIFLRAAAALGATPATCIVLEDADVGVEAGKRAGMRVYAVTTTRRREALRAADRIVDSLADLGPDDFAL